MYKSILAPDPPFEIPTESPPPPPLSNQNAPILSPPVASIGGQFVLLGTPNAPPLIVSNTSGSYLTTLAPAVNQR